MAEDEEIKQPEGEKPDEAKRWKMRFAILGDVPEEDLKDIPEAVAIKLIDDPDVAPNIAEAIATSLLKGAKVAVEGTETPAAEAGPDVSQAPPEESVVEKALKARKEREERQEKQEQAKKLSLLSRIQRMDVAERGKLARGGDAEARSILIRDSNKQVAMAVLGNPKLTVHEVEIVAQSRNVNEEILREIGGNRDWCKQYSVILALVNNPKTPVGVSLTHLTKIMTRDLRFLSKSKGVPEPIKASAKRLAQKRSV